MSGSCGLRLPWRVAFFGAAVALFAAAIGWPHSAAVAQADPRIAVAKGKNGGKVSWYTSVAPDELRKALLDDFKKKTGLDVNVYYGGTGQVFSRLTTERKTKSYQVDVVTLGDLDLVAQLVKEKAFRPHKPESPQGTLTDYIDPAGFWHGICFWVLALEYNTRLMKAEDLPKSWLDLADPKYKGKIALTDPARSAGGFLLLKAMVSEKGWPWVEALMKNEPLIIAIGPGIEQALANGERAIGTVISSFASENIKAKAPVAIAPGEFLFASPLTASVVTEAPNPEGAELLLEHFLTKESGQHFATYGWFSTRSDVGGPLGFPPAGELKVRHKVVPSQMSRQEYLDKYNAIVQSVKK